MMRDCILITVEYPFGKSETFLESEIYYLSEQFEKVYIFPFYGTSGSYRAVPENVEFFSLNLCHGKKRYPLYAFKGFFMKDSMLKSYFPSIKKLLIGNYYKGRGLSAYKEILNIINDNNLSINNPVCYSYWFTDLAYVSWKMSNHFKKSGINSKAVTRAHGYDLYWERNKLKFLPYQDVAIKQLDKVYCCSVTGRNYLIDKYGFESKIDISRLGTRDCGIAEINYEKKCFLTCSSIVEVKRLDMFAKAFAKVCEKHPECRWIHIGDGPLRERVTGILKKRNVFDKVQFCGSMKNEEVMNFYKQTTVFFFCNVSYSEGVPVSIMEALSFGIPIVATNVGGNKELVSDGINGFLIPDLSLKKMIEKLESAIETDTHQYSSMRMEARKKWELLANADINYRKWAELLYE